MSRWPKKKIRFHRDTYPGHRWNLGDFILWMGHGKDRKGDVSWNTKLGRGRPSWNVQDPAMITKHLGYQIDISCGGIDNLYRHHDYNIAVIEGVSGKKFANYWLHAEHVLVDGIKMSKSRGNIVYVEDMLDSGISPHHLRFYLLYGHYRDRLNLNREHLHLARGRIDALRDLAGKIGKSGPAVKKSDHRAARCIRRLEADFQTRMNQDLDVKGAFDAVYESVEMLARMAAHGGLSAADRHRAAKALNRIDGVLQVMK